jgi:hypothetical protein
MGAFDWRNKLIARGHPRARVSEIRDKGLAKIVGRIIAFEPTIESPIFHRKCVSYVVKGVSSGRRDHVAVERELHDFIVDDETGRAFVQLRPNCHVLLGKYRETKSRLFRREELTPEAVDFFRRNNIETHGLSDYVHESVLRPGQVVVVYGRADVLDSPGRGPYCERIVTFTAREPLLITDDLSCGR